MRSQRPEVQLKRRVGLFGDVGTGSPARRGSREDTTKPSGEHAAYGPGSTVVVMLGHFSLLAAHQSEARSGGYLPSGTNRLSFPVAWRSRVSVRVMVTLGSLSPRPLLYVGSGALAIMRQHCAARLQAATDGFGGQLRPVGDPELGEHV